MTHSVSSGYIWLVFGSTWIWNKLQLPLKLYQEGQLKKYTEKFSSWGNDSHSAGQNESPVFIEPEGYFKLQM
jgi:hypothetical protein